MFEFLTSPLGFFTVVLFALFVAGVVLRAIATRDGARRGSAPPRYEEAAPSRYEEVLNRAATPRRKAHEPRRKATSSESRRPDDGVASSVYYGNDGWSSSNDCADGSSGDGGSGGDGGCGGGDGGGGGGGD